MRKSLFVLLFFLAVFMVACGKVSNETLSKSTSKAMGSLRVFGNVSLSVNNIDEVKVSSNELVMILYRLDVDGSLSIISWGEALVTTNSGISTAYNSEGNIIKKDAHGDVFLQKKNVSNVVSWDYSFLYKPYQDATYLLNYYDEFNKVDNFIYIKGEEVSKNITRESEQFSTYNTFVSRIIMSDEQKKIKTKSSLNDEKVKNVLGKEFMDLISYFPKSLRVPSFNYKRPIYSPVSSNMVEYWLDKVVVNFYENKKEYKNYIYSLPKSLFPTFSIDYLIKQDIKDSNKKLSPKTKLNHKPFVPVKIKKPVSNSGVKSWRK